MFLKKKEDRSFTEQRDRIVRYKKVFGSIEGRQVLIDLMDRNFLVQSHGGDLFKEGRRTAILEIMQTCNVDLAAFDSIVRGEYKLEE